MSARFRARAPGPVSGQLCSASGGGAGHDGAGFLLPFGRRRSLRGHPVPPGDSAPLAIGLPHHPLAARTRTGFPCSARVRHSWGRVPSLPRGLRCLPRPGAIPGRRTPPHSGRSLSPRYSFPSRGVPITGHQQGFTGIHPSQPFPRLCSPDGTGNLGLFLSFTPGRARPSRAHQGGNEPQALPGVTSSAR